MNNKFQLPPLPYQYADLEPYIDEQTMLIHHTKHHQTYVDKLNEALEAYPELFNQSIERLLASFGSIPDDVCEAVRKYGGGHANHSLLWKIMTPHSQVVNSCAINAITNKYNSLDTFYEQFTKTALGVFGSGWTWLVKSGNDLEITTTPNQDSPLMHGLKPILGVDVWEHAYYLKYQNKRNEYLENYIKIINWEEVDKLYNER